ncbi:MAG: hypothetical protein LKI53_00685 [Bacteroidales bacterium]|jgi:hypothetical protein|nr:hypothetical protein [Bacteroidales bacterium]
MKKLLSLIALFLILSIPAIAQFDVEGDNPAGLRWRKIESEHYRLIYPRGADSLARRYIWLMEYARDSVMKNLDENPKRIPVLLNTLNSYSNGLVTWAPRRVELNTLPEASGTLPENWEEQLTLHESRHIGQITNFTNGIFRPLGWLLGESAAGLGVGVYPARWFLEGDAVVSETNYSGSGRGHDPSFTAYYRASEISGEKRNWDRWRFGSYKKYTPSVYPFGYVLETTAQRMAGDSALPGKIMDYYLRNFWNPDSPGAAYRKYTGMSQKQVFAFGLDSLGYLWRKDDASRGTFLKSRMFYVKRDGYFTEYSEAAPISADSVLFIKSGYGESASLVIVSDSPNFLANHPGGEERLSAFDADASGLVYGYGNAYFCAGTSNPRWTKEVYSDLFAYDLHAGKIKRITHKKYYYNPDVSPGGDTLAVVSYNPRGGSRLVLLDVSGREISSVPAPFDGQITECLFACEGIFATVISSSDKRNSGMGLYKISLSDIASGNSGGWKQVLGEQNRTISDLSCYNNKLYFLWNPDGVSNLYSMDPHENVISRISNSRFGITGPDVRWGRAYYSEMSTEGYYPAFALLGDMGNSDGVEIRIFSPETSGKKSGNIFASLQGKENPYAGLESKRYSKATHLFRFHSWAPVYYNYDRLTEMSSDHTYQQVAPGAVVYSQNTLGTAVTMLGYSHHDGRNAGHFSFEYSGWLPVIKLYFDVNDEKRYNLDFKRRGDTLYRYIYGGKTPLWKGAALVYVPVVASGRGWNRIFIPYIKYSSENNRFSTYNSNRFYWRNDFYYGLSYKQTLPVAKAAIFPKWGFGMTVNGDVPLGKDKLFCPVFAAEGYVYLPGIWKRQGLKLSACYQNESSSGKPVYYYSDNLVSLPRGYDNDAYHGKNYYGFSADYAMPFYLGDVSLGWFAYLQRLQIIPFADYGVADSPHGRSYLHSAGSDFVLDCHVGRIGFPVSLGVRCAVTGHDNGNSSGTGYLGFLFGISLY